MNAQESVFILLLYLKIDHITNIGYPFRSMLVYIVFHSFMCSCQIVFGDPRNVFMC
jgi:hypothetical protein